MSQQQLKLLSTTIPEKTRPEKSFVQLEGELTQEQLEAIALRIWQWERREPQRDDGENSGGSYV